MSYVQSDSLDEQSTLKDRYLTFPLANDMLAIDIKYVTEIIGIQAITKVPNVPHFVEGVINLRGKIIPVINVRAKFQMQKVSYDFKTNIIIVNYKDVVIGLIVDSVEEVLIIKEENISAYHKEKKSKQDDFIKGVAKVDDEVKLIISCRKIVDIATK